LFHTAEALAYVAHGIIITSGLWIGCMTIVQFLWTKFPWEHKPYMHLFFEIILITIYTIIFSCVLYSIEIRIGLDHAIENPAGEIAVTLLITYFISAIHEAVYFYRQWKYNFSRSVRLEKAKIEANFETLKAQVNPHFIFNSLNSLSSMVDDNPAAVDYIQNLSGFLRYLLSTNEKELVSLNDEMAIVSSYIDLLRSRFGENLKLNTTIQENMNLLLVPPLSVQMLVENCIKHNIISNDKPLEISIFTEGDYLQVENRIQAKMDVQKSGYGLKNIIERYSYFTEKKPEIVETPVHFKVKIPLLKKEL
jgi:LytS/YehU family sensor histidine kinase